MAREHVSVGRKGRQQSTDVVGLVLRDPKAVFPRTVILQGEEDDRGSDFILSALS